MIRYRIRFRVRFRPRSARLGSVDLLSLFGIQSLDRNFGRRTGPHFGVVPSVGQNSANSAGRKTIDLPLFFGGSGPFPLLVNQFRGFRGFSAARSDARRPEMQLLPGRNSPHNQNPSLDALGKKLGFFDVLRT